MTSKLMDRIRKKLSFEDNPRTNRFLCKYFKTRRYYIENVRVYYDRDKNRYYGFNDNNDKQHLTLPEHYKVYPRVIVTAWRVLSGCLCYLVFLSIGSYIVYRILRNIKSIIHTVIVIVQNIPYYVNLLISDPFVYFLLFLIGISIVLIILFALYVWLDGMSYEQRKERR